MRLSLLYKPLVNGIRFKLAKLRYDYVPNAATVEQFSFLKLHHLVLVKPDGKLGDTQVISMFIDVLQKTCPQLTISVLCPKGILEIYRDILKVRVFEVSKRPSFAELRGIVEQLSHLGKVDLLISTERVMRPRDLYLAHLCRPQILVGMDTRVQCINYQLVGYDSNFRQHLLCYFLDLLKAGGIIPEHYAYRQLYNDTQLAFAQQLFVKGSAVGVLPFGAATDKRLSYDTILSVCRCIEQHTSYTIVPLLTDSEGETLSRLQQDLAAERVLILPKLNISQFAACISCLVALVSVDTAGVHLAVASRVPVLGLYQGFGTEATLWAPGPLATSNSMVFRQDGKVISEISYQALEPRLKSFLQHI